MLPRIAFDPDLSKNLIFFLVPLRIPSQYNNLESRFCFCPKIRPLGFLVQLSFTRMLFLETRSQPLFYFQDLLTEVRITTHFLFLFLGLITIKPWIWQFLGVEVGGGLCLVPGFVLHVVRAWFGIQREGFFVSYNH